MELNLYDTLTREKRVFTPLDPADVRMYVCGPTVYDFAHIGNARPVIVFDVLFRLLRHLYGPDHVAYVRNITDVDDKINGRAAQRLAQRGEEGGDLNAEIRALTEETYANFKADVAALGCLPPTVEPRATEHIEEMKSLIERLVASGHAYVAEDHVLFAVASMPDYGRLSKRPLDEMIAGARVEVAPFKRDAMDFVLWKPSRPGEPAWPSPCDIAAPGRPGWHIECSAMSDYWLWAKAEPRLSPAGLAHPHQFDIHGGGVDLVFPHHENEIAQSRCAFHTPVMANYWMHNGFLKVEGEKMAKSLGNFITIREVLKDWPGDVIRLNMLKTHYRQPIDWTVTGLEMSRHELYEWTRIVSDGEFQYRDQSGSAIFPEVISALSDDLNTPAAIASIHAAVSASGVHHDVVALGKTLEFLGFHNVTKPGLFSKAIAGYIPEEKLTAALFPAIKLRVATANNDVRAIEDANNAAFAVGVRLTLNECGDVDVRLLDVGAEQSFKEKVNALIATRTAARKAKNWVESDRIRDELAAMGIVLKDSKDPQTGEPVTTWEVAR